MAVKWINLPTESFIYQPDQVEFLESRKARICVRCTKSVSKPFEFVIAAPTFRCPKCGDKGMRKFNFLTIIAGRRWGKSRVGSIAGAEEATIPGTIGWACAPTNPKLHRYVIPAFQSVIPDSWVEDWNKEFLDLRLKNGSLIHFQTLEHPDQGRGQGLDWLWIDEVCELSKQHWEVIRPSLAGDTAAFFTTSPKGFDWVYKELYLPAEKQVPGFWGCHTKTNTSSNPKISNDFLARERATMSDEMYRQEYEADFVTFMGAVYSTNLNTQIINERDHLDKIKELLPEWPDIAPWRQILIGIDTGADHPFGAVKLVSTEGGLVVVGEYLHKNRSFSEHAYYLLKLASSPNVKWAINKNEKQQTIELGQHGIYCQKAENDVVAGTERVKSWLKAEQLWFIESQAPETVKQMKAYRWKDSEASDGSLRKETVYKLDDELPDAIRYALMTWPVLPVPKLPDANAPRDLSKLPDEMAAAISRMRRIDGAPKPVQSAVEDFWG